MVLYTGCVTDENAEIKTNSSDCAVLDSGCSSNVCGKLWLDNYLKNLDQEDRDEIYYSSGKKLFTFGCGTQLKSKGGGGGGGGGSVLFQHLLQTDV